MRPTTPGEALAGFEANPTRPGAAEILASFRLGERIVRPRLTAPPRPRGVPAQVAVVMVLWLGATLSWYLRRPRQRYRLDDATGTDYDDEMLADEPMLHDL